MQNELNELEAYQYCPEVPFNREVKYCYPELKIDHIDVMGLSLLGLVAVVAIVINILDWRK